MHSFFIMFVIMPCFINVPFPPIIQVEMKSNQKISQPSMMNCFLFRVQVTMREDKVVKLHIAQLRSGLQALGTIKKNCTNVTRRFIFTMWGRSDNCNVEDSYTELHNFWRKTRQTIGRNCQETVHCFEDEEWAHHLGVQPGIFIDSPREIEWLEGGTGNHFCTVSQRKYLS